VSLRHGDTSTYFIGTTDDTGRKLQVNYVLLWEAILYAKKSGCEWFDIGGLNATTPKGIAHFKSGLNSELYSLVGEWRGFIAPWKSIKNI
jgi:lipid II:glycine glycyltransferase (peptidoglycan interpeptide bridge formation enzyme)